MSAGTPPPASGTVVVCGCVDPDVEGRSSKTPREGLDHLVSPHVVEALSGVKIASVASGSAACHSVAIGADGALWVWGRNDHGQLGLGDTSSRSAPTKLALPGNAVAASASCGKQHTAVVTTSGDCFTFGSNAYGQLGQPIPSKDKDPKILEPKKAAVAAVASVACGGEFTLFLTKSGAVYSCGCPQYGQLGNGTTGEYNTKESSIKMAFRPHPNPLVVSGALAGKKIRAIAAGTNHALAADTDGAMYSWGWGGFGRLGHQVQKDELVPKQIELFKTRMALPADALIAAGGSISFAVGPGGQPYVWGKVKATGDAYMYPKPLYDLSGWTLRALSCGHTSTAVGAEVSAIVFGAAAYGELGLGPKKKSSANPAKVDDLEGLTTIATAAGVGHTLFVVSGDEKLIANLPTFSPPADQVEVDVGSKRKAKAADTGGKGAKKAPKKTKK